MGEFCFRTVTNVWSVNMHEDYYIELIRKDIMHLISDQEREVLRKWRVADSANDDLAHEMYQSWQKSESFGENIDVDVHTDFAKVMQRISLSESTSPSLLRRLWIPSMVASLALLIGAWFFTQRTDSNSVRYNTTVIAQSDKQIVQFSDGSSVTMQKGSKIRYNKEFVDGRNVIFDGQGYFKVEKEADRQFSVESDHLITNVLGTEFFVSDGQEIFTPIVRLVKGKVQVSSKVEDISLDLLPLQAAVLSNGKLSRESFELQDKEVSWYYDMIQFSDVPLQEVVEILSDVQDVEIILSEEIKNCRFSANVRPSDLENLLNAIASLNSASLSKNGDKYEFSGGICGGQ